jgi:hypothetical protein
MIETTTVDSTETPDASSIISAIAKGDTVGAGINFTDLMAAKQQDALELRKQEFANQLFTPVEEPEMAEPIEDPAVEEE